MLSSQPLAMSGKPPPPPFSRAPTSRLFPRPAKHKFVGPVPTLPTAPLLFLGLQGAGSRCHGRPAGHLELVCAVLCALALRSPPARSLTGMLPACDLLAKEANGAAFPFAYNAVQGQFTKLELRCLGTAFGVRRGPAFPFLFPPRARCNGQGKVGILGRQHPESTRGEF